MLHICKYLDWHFKGIFHYWNLYIKSNQLINYIAFRQNHLTHWPLVNLNRFQISTFQVNFSDGWGISCEIALAYLSLDWTDDELKLVHAMAWCHQATSHYLIQCWPIYVWPYGITTPQWVKFHSMYKTNIAFLQKYPILAQNQIILHMRPKVCFPRLKRINHRECISIQTKELIFNSLFQLEW